MFTMQTDVSLPAIVVLIQYITYRDVLMSYFRVYNYSSHCIDCDSLSILFSLFYAEYCLLLDSLRRSRQIKESYLGVSNAI